MARRLLREVVDEIVGDLGRTIADNRANVTRFGTRFMDTALVSRNINRIVASLAGDIPPRLGAPPAPQPLRSKMCNHRDFLSDWLGFWAGEIGERARFDRKLWEFCYVAHALYGAGMLRPGRQGVGFGCGREPLPALFAKHGAAVLATDLPATHGDAGVWRSANAHADSREAVLRPDICPAERLAAITFASADMNDLPTALDHRFDFCWSCCALEHLGSIERGLAFIERSLDMLQPGGVAVHTTEFALDEAAAIDNFGTVLFRAEHFIDLAKRVRRRGCELAELDFDPGDHLLDRLPTLATLCPDVEAEPGLVRIKVSLGGFVCTSFGLILVKQASPDTPDTAVV